MKKTLKDLREAKRLTQSQVANACGMTLRNYQYLESDDSKIKGLALESACKLAYILDCKIEQLIDVHCYQVFHILSHQEETIFTSFNKKDAIDYVNHLIRYDDYNNDELEIRYDVIKTICDNQDIIYDYQVQPFKYYLDKQYQDSTFDDTYYSYESDAYDDMYFDTYEDAREYADKCQYRLESNEILEIIKIDE